MEIKIIKENKRSFLDLLLLADEQENMIDKYLTRGEMFALYDGDLKSICVVTNEEEGIYEIKNLATYEKYQGQGYGSRLIKFIFEYYKDNCKTMLVGTGDSPLTIPFYKYCGFKISHRVKNFFIDNYDHPIYESGVQLIDMIYLKKDF
ncbi:TPA: GNAT family N-acetyltransferase [Clostridium botulinum]|uniref:GNAT family N-acetyltransferase n=1 Tax=Clostridium botulinum TaxID=1491 RepID=UPI00099D3CDB|nr:GNAT family N-acetyltransferase [Clostridium botulinum]NFB52390.1 N-acetyltransferase [Clostridium botulinum]NFD06329.1 N-acetyltransferase [Clostridium botulinum]NFF11067.1 N-acetyltransferase [Clostridium botulinum]OPD30982.1 GNAT family acetyltransferase [Clostridium botulinum]HCL4437740.1 GNAT family N-acetyltransferase [Clostridium botulinum]